MTSSRSAASLPSGSGAAGDQLRYATEVVAVGDLVPQFLEQGVLVLFGEQAPEELHEFSVLHRPGSALSGPEPGDVLVIGTTELPVLAVGDVVAENLLQLGHLDIKADGRDEAAMPGDLCVPQVALPRVAPGDQIRILRGRAARAAREGDRA
ncbi:MAG TPA: PTS glucitol/sorbitol transporter subunit IIA [Actinomycetales bacterium]|nr:PTS glucitol/sorbitol transporter subunit IIA [Actinomycetales bacterium]